MSVRTVMALVIAGLFGLLAGVLLVVLMDDHSGPAIVIEPASIDGTVVVQVFGAVATPGVYALPGGSRTQDAIAAAGGYTTNADTSELNLARRLGDAEKIVVPTVSPGESTGNDPSLTLAAARVNINSASQHDLELLPGIGPALATAIIRDRDLNGPFIAVDDLDRVPGISTAMVAELVSLVTVDE